MLEIIKTLINLIVTIVFDLMIFVVMFQLLLELMGPYYHHPIRQAILRYTQPLVDPIHRVFPTYRHLDLGLIFLIFVLEIVKLLLLFLLEWQFPNLALLFVWSIFLIINSVINFFFFAVLFRLLVSLIIPIYSNHPATQILYLLTDPILKPLRQRVRISKFDWTPILLMVILKVLSYLVLYVLSSLGAPNTIL